VKRKFRLTRDSFNSSFRFAGVGLFGTRWHVFVVALLGYQGLIDIGARYKIQTNRLEFSQTSPFEGLVGFIGSGLE
jgi:ABC-type transporter lipoprotein component MlaA